MGTFTELPMLCVEEEIIAKTSRNVFIDYDGVKNLAREVIRFMLWNYNHDMLSKVGNNYLRHLLRFYPDNDDYRCADWLFVLNTLNFSLFLPKSVKQWTVNGFTGYWALCSAMRRAIIDEGKPLWNPDYYMNISVSDMEQIFRGDDGSCIPFMTDRLRILHDIGKILVNKYNGRFAYCIVMCNYNVMLLMLLLTSEFQCYRDEGIYNRKKVCLLTKAKILINELSCFFPINMTLRSKVSTLFIDYRAPQVLVHFKALRYSEALKKRFEKNNQPISQGSPEDLELRSCSIVTIRMVREEVEKMFESVAEDIPNLKAISHSISILVDNFVFHYRHEWNKELMDNVPLHNIITVHY
ncbi:queuosine salvage protein-like [Pogonomyrmex barbatus]|uniref:Queuosine 5'-phosphate N-glycosylase/hydrolase n=1 Tax=Pogonomyrmex barbatus TaxID=144034 RepID=A0A6I9W4W6_9HYME|nr:queuosine salvage protein-like [Pogonomyrmex barbatus]